MDSEWIIPPPNSPEGRVRIELTESELVALISRCVPLNTWMRQQSNRVVRLTFKGGLPEAQEVADQITHQLIRAHDQMNNPNWRRRSDGADLQIDGQEHPNG
jgi:hypothetical protein